MGSYIIKTSLSCVGNHASTLMANPFPKTNIYATFNDMKARQASFVMRMIGLQEKTQVHDNATNN